MAWAPRRARRPRTSLSARPSSLPRRHLGAPGALASPGAVRPGGRTRHRRAERHRPPAAGDRGGARRQLRLFAARSAAAAAPWSGDTAAAARAGAGPLWRGRDSIPIPAQPGGASTARRASGGMNILFLAPQPFYQERGTPIAIKLALTVLCAAGHKVDLVTYHEGADLEIQGMRTFRIAKPPFASNVPIGFSGKKLLCDVYLSFMLWRLLVRNRYDVIHAVEARSEERRVGNAGQYV